MYGAPKLYLLAAEPEDVQRYITLRSPFFARTKSKLGLMLMAPIA